MREARRIEQSHNPNYLKSKSTTKKNKSDELKDDLDDIPIQEIQLDVPLQITCKPMIVHSFVDWEWPFEFLFYKISNKALGQIPRWSKETD